jgi:hypothetical protein
MLEEVRGVRWCASTKQQSCLGQLRQRRLQFGLSALRHRLDQLVGKFATEHRADLCHFPGYRADAVEPRNQ